MGVNYSVVNKFFRQDLRKSMAKVGQNVGTSRDFQCKLGIVICSSDVDSVFIQRKQI